MIAVDALSVSQGRLRALFAAGLAVTSELSLEALLHRLVEAAAELTGARYAALGVIDASGSQLEQFLTHGIDVDTRASIGSLPRGRGILGVLIRDAKPLRLHDLGEDPRSVGFPPGHPPMRSFLGVPILLRGVAYGNLYLTEKEGGEDFSEEDEELVTLLAGQAAVAIENARLYEASARWSLQLQSLEEVGNALATETDLGRLLDLIVRPSAGAARRQSCCGRPAQRHRGPCDLPLWPGTSRTSCSARRSRVRPRRAVESSRAVAASASTPSLTIPRSTGR